MYSGKIAVPPGGGGIVINNNNNNYYYYYKHCEEHRAEDKTDNIMVF
jgi:hypothetical protein